MMRSLIIVLMFVAAAITAADNIDSGSSDLEIVEVFRAETPEELEAALTDGYPMPWLEEILSDESIPEEDRYWLDCRVRAAIARDLSLFFDRDGNPVHIECDYMHPGEDYWREHFIVNLPGESYRFDSPDMPTGITDQPGYIVNLFGERVGDIALSRSRIWLARDASVGIGICDYSWDGRRANSACFLYPDGSFIEKEIDPIFVQFALSEDGSIAVYYSASAHDYDSPERMLYAFDSNGELIFHRLMPTGPMSGSATPAISPDNTIIAAPIAGSMVWLLDAGTGEKLFQWGGLSSEGPERYAIGHHLTFSQNSRYLCASGGDAVILDCENGEVVMRVSRSMGHFEDNPPYTDETLTLARTDNTASLLGCVRRIRLHDGTPFIKISFESEVYNISGALDLLLDDSYPYPSPNGIFLLLDNYDSHYFDGPYSGDTATPLTIFRMREVQ
ncbi:MAG: hypothetical protein GQ565_07305 [Candidatus Aegiribacteria sp.]|nr:hypothetical protein [Candidatus Aegiribacteria sp.]